MQQTFVEGGANGQGWLLEHTKREVMEKSQACRYMCGAINAMKDVFSDPHLAQRAFFAEVDHPHVGTLRYAGAQFNMSETPSRAGCTPLLGEHPEEVPTGVLN